MEAAVMRIDEALSGAQWLMKQMEDCIGKLADEVNKFSQDKARQAFEDVEQRVAIVVNEIGVAKADISQMQGLQSQQGLGVHTLVVATQQAMNQAAANQQDLQNKVEDMKKMAIGGQSGHQNRGEYWRAKP